MPIDLFQVDAFTPRAFSGNPAAVCLCPEAREPAWMQQVAAEMNLSETSFVVPRPDGFDLRWFTPTVEVELCGHATLAAAHVLWESGRLAAGAAAHFHTRSGTLIAAKAGDWIELDFPATPASPVDEASAESQSLLRSLGVRARSVGRSRFDYLVEVATADEVSAAAPDMVALKRVDSRAAIVTAPGKPPYDMVSRVFAPSFGIDEDPVTGSAHCVLGPFWGERLGKQELLAYQASARGGVLRVVLAGTRVKLYGQAVTTSRGLLMV
jgi:PhzF family phenazine biosynthesis protein